MLATARLFKCGNQHFSGCLVVIYYCNIFLELYPINVFTSLAFKHSAVILHMHITSEGQQFIFHDSGEVCPRSPQKEFNIKAPSKEGDFLKKRFYFFLIFCHKILSLERVLLFKNQPDKLPVNLVPLLNLPGAVNRLHQLREPLFSAPGHPIISLTILRN